MAEKYIINEVRINRLESPHDQKIGIQETANRLNELIKAWNGFVPTTSGGGGAVNSFALRTGAVVPVAGDYPPAFIGALPATARGQANGVAALGPDQFVSPSQLGFGPTGTKFLRGDKTWQDLPVAGGAIPLAEKGAASGVATLDGGSKVPTAQLATGAPDGTKFLRDDRVWAVPSGGGSFVPLTHLSDADPHTQYQKESEKGAASGYAGLGAGSLVPTAQLGTGTADNTTFLRGDGTWDTPAGGGGGGTVSVWNWDMPPASPSAIDDEFDAALSGWTNYGAASTKTQVGSTLKLEVAAGATFNFGGIERVLPAGNFTVVTRMWMMASGAYSLSGIYLRNAATDKMMDFHIFRNSTGITDLWLEVDRYVAFNNRSAIAAQTVTGWRQLFMRISYDGTTLAFDYSENGVHWLNYYSEAVATHFGASLPDRVGLGIDPYTGVTGQASYEFFRYYPAADQPTGGMMLVS